MSPIISAAPCCHVMYMSKVDVEHLQSPADTDAQLTDNSYNAILNCKNWGYIKVLKAIFLSLSILQFPSPKLFILYWGSYYKINIETCT